MLEQIVQLLKVDEFYGKSEYIEQVKGRYKTPTSIKGVFKWIKRRKRWQ